MVDYNELRKKFRPKEKPGKKPSGKAAARTIALEYEIKKAALGGPPSLMRRGPLFFGFVLLILVAVAGHILNLALGFLGVLVHAVRLNTLEFSNHMGLQWAGFKFKPFSAKQNND